MATRCKYYIFRHGETFSTRDKVPYGDKQFEAQLLPEYHEPIKRIGKYLRYTHSDYNFTSELLRCIQTSQIVSQETGKEFIKEPLLNEYTENTFEDFKKRMVALVEKLESRSGASYLICTHGAVISALKHLIIYNDYSLDNLMDFPRPGTLMLINNAGSEILDFNS